VIIFAGSQRLIGDNFTTGTFFVFIMAFLNVYRPLKDISNGFMNYQFALDAGRRLIILRQRAALAENNQGQLSVANFDRLEIKNLWFSYYDRPDDRKPYLLKDLSMEIQAGETVAIAGPTGIGKSTLCDLICRLYQPCQGEILINGTPAPSINKESYTRLFSLCSQETIVFNNSLLDEIRIAAPEASQEEVMETAEAAGLSRLIKSGQRDWNTWIGNRGVQFSGGQRQMIAIARALLRKPKVLILDEAMSGLDIQMIRTIWQNIRKLLPDTAIITVSHNWEVIKQAQRILILREGRIQNSMKPIDISDRDSFFKDLNLAQVECHEEDDPAASLHDRPAQL
jgi:ABC-type bacteriocin/lantibiotic exporter with double-glycine peptidase domain